MLNRDNVLYTAQLYIRTFRSDRDARGFTSVSVQEGRELYLKQIELENFKSFGGKLTIPLMEGYMAITGPNGSGKSNITDAILFVLGPKSSKAVRAGKLTDLIFDGGKGQGKANYMKVSLVFDNKDRIMPWDDDIVRLTRFVKFTDNGTDYNSYFYVNDHKSSLTEFDSLLTKARISADGYNMVQQGDVTRIVQMGNLERRRVLDSISGIASFDTDIEKASVERAEAKANLERIGIITGELEGQIKKLEKDREDARKYLELQKQLDMARAQLVHRQHSTEIEKLAGIESYISEITKTIGDLTAKKEELKAEYDENEIAVAAKEKEISDRIGPEYNKVKQQIEDAKVDIATQKSRSEQAEEDRLQQEGFKAKFTESVADNRKEYKAASESLKDILIKRDEASDKYEIAKAEDEKISAEMMEHGGEHTELQNRLQKLDTDIDASEKTEHAAQIASAKASTAADDAARAKAVLDERLQSAAFDIKDAEWNLQQVKAEAGAGSVEEFSKKILALRKDEAELERQEGELRNIADKLDKEYNQLSAEKNVSERMNRGSDAVAAILGLRDKGQMAGIHGTIQELATVEPGYETALSVAAGGKMQAVVVDDDQVAADGIAYLKKERLGRVTFLPLSKMMSGKPRAKAIMIQKQTDGYATDLIKYDRIYENAFWYVFQDTLVVGSMESARSLMGGVRLVTKGGELIEASGAMVGGTLSPQSVMKFGSSSQSKLEEVGNKLREVNASMDVLRSKLRGIRDSIRAADDEMRKANAAGMGGQAKIGQLNAQLSELKKAKQSLSEEFKIKSAECEKAEKDRSDAGKALADSTAALEKLRSNRTSVRARIAEIAPAGMQEKIQGVRDRVHRHKGELSDLDAQKVSTEAEIQGLNAQKDALEMQISSVEKKIAEDLKIIAEHDAKRDAKQVELDALRRIEANMQKGIEGLRTQKEALVANRYRIDGDRRAAQEKIEVNTGIKSSQEAQSTICRSNIEQLKAEVAAITFEVEKPVPSEEELKRTVRSCENAITRIGNVNMRAIEDYDEKKARYDSLMSDVGSLNKRIMELDKLTDSLSSQKKGLFMQSYNAIDANFKEIYAQLSGGGEAFIGLEDKDDPFAGGLMINAKPKNGKLLRLEALSGGEKSLTALAFIFAIQEYQPSPFYVLDEVDMFLDAVNAEMVAKRVKESSAKAQFIQVSLRKVTLAMADHLIGVTRPPSGISKVIMQPDFDEVAKYEEEAERQRQHAD